jgi:hypothetical protein
MQSTEVRVEIDWVSAVFGGLISADTPGKRIMNTRTKSMLNLKNFIPSVPN